MKKFRVFLSAFLAGVAFSIGTCAFLKLESTSLLGAAFMFSVGIIFVLNFRLNLFTSKAGELYFNFKRLDEHLVALLFTLLGNLVGAAASGFALSPIFGEKAAEISESMLSTPLLNVLIGSIFCGMLLFAATLGYVRQNGGFEGAFIACLATTVFVICGFENSLSDMFCFIAGGFYNFNAFVHILAVVFGNAVGALVFVIIYDAKKSGRESRAHHHHSHKQSEK